VFFRKESEKPSEEKSVEKLSGKKPSEQSQPKLKPKLVWFHCDYCRRDGHKGEFCFKKKCEERMEKEWSNKDRYNPSHGVPKSCMPLPRGKVVVRIVPAWGEKSALGGRDPVGRVKSVRPVPEPIRLVPKPVRPVWRQQDQAGFHARDESRFVSGGCGSGGWSR
jgi:hypothetical protein